VILDEVFVFIYFLSNSVSHGCERCRCEQCARIANTTRSIFVSKLSQLPKTTENVALSTIHIFLIQISLLTSLFEIQLRIFNP